jgi:hypothetical protein
MHVQNIFYWLFQRIYHNNTRRYFARSSAKPVGYQVIHFLQFSSKDFQMFLSTMWNDFEISLSYIYAWLFYYSLLLMELLSYSAFWWDIYTIGKLFPCKKTIICWIHNISFWTLKHTQIRRRLQCQSSPCWQQTINRLQRPLF